jgi:hypothetical protein
MSVRDTDTCFSAAKIPLEAPQQGRTYVGRATHSVPNFVTYSRTAWQPTLPHTALPGSRGSASGSIARPSL